MRIEIDEKGFLRLERAGKMKPQYCPHYRHAVKECGDWCALFREPEILETMVEVGLCEMYMHCDISEFTDGRAR